MFNKTRLGFYAAFASAFTTIAVKLPTSQVLVGLCWFTAMTFYMFSSDEHD
ncbi:hypothetical protein [Loigolactobacillus bifermentans]|uniref:hypothetical protein n=1 Tax=Loigolactobacillus bifermentans TaxID=1607 RepID=UPI000A997CE3|nr:hypothetical protein [Loigolactobacillus bifermentans]QGG61043.1 hypothetical protein LB003_11550 [Loigolactobacillus bifermentans]